MSITNLMEGPNQLFGDAPQLRSRVILFAFVRQRFEPLNIQAAVQFLAKFYHFQPSAVAPAMFYFLAPCPLGFSAAARLICYVLPLKWLPLENSAALSKSPAAPLTPFFPR